MFRFMWITRHLLRSVIRHPRLSKDNVLELMKEEHEAEYEAAVRRVYGDDRGVMP